MKIDRELLNAGKQLSQAVAALKFGLPVTHVYNPLEYAWTGFEQYVKRFGNSRKKVVFFGMNPGPFGMVQTGVPFGEIAAVRDWMKIKTDIARPQNEHPKRPVLGFDCTRSEVSGQRLWGLFAKRYSAAENFFEDHFVVNYIPLAFLEESGRNFTPDKLPASERDALVRACDAHLRVVLDILKPSWIVGVGAFAAQRAESLETGAKVGQILHPSPASPAANRDWAGQATAQLKALGIWK